MILFGHVYFALISQRMLSEVIVTPNGQMFQSELFRFDVILTVHRR